MLMMLGNERDGAVPVDDEDGEGDFLIWSRVKLLAEELATHERVVAGRDDQGMFVLKIEIIV